MGNDGGSIPTRRELVKEAARNPTTAQIKESQSEQQVYYWTTDPVTQKPLVEPVVSDAHGKLYNKDTILEFLLEGANKVEVDRVSHGTVSSLKDIVELKFHLDAQKAWSCPITGDKLGPGEKAVYVVPCGHVFSATAIKEVSENKCLTCESEFAANDIIPIVPVAEDDIARLTLRLKTLQERGLSHCLKKASGGKKRKKHVEDQETAVKTPLTENSNINNASTASLTAKVLQAQDQSKKRRQDNDNVKSLFSNSNVGGKNGRNNDFMTRGFDVPVTSKR